MGGSCSDRDAEAHQGKPCDPEGGQGLVSSKDGPQQDRSDGPISESGHAEPDHTSAHAPSHESSSEDNSSHKALSVLVGTVGGALGVALALFFGGILPLSAVLLSTVSLALSVLWVLVVALLIASTAILLYRKKSI